MRLSNNFQAWNEDSEFNQLLIRVVHHRRNKIALSPILIILLSQYMIQEIFHFLFPI